MGRELALKLRGNQAVKESADIDDVAIRASLYAPVDGSDLLIEKMGQEDLPEGWTEEEDDPTIWFGSEEGI